MQIRGNEMTRISEPWAFDNLQVQNPEVSLQSDLDPFVTNQVDTQQELPIIKKDQNNSFMRPSASNQDQEAQIENLALNTQPMPSLPDMNRLSLDQQMVHQNV